MKLRMFFLAGIISLSVISLAQDTYQVPGTGNYLTFRRWTPGEVLTHDDTTVFWTPGTAPSDVSGTRTYGDGTMTLSGHCESGLERAYARLDVTNTSGDAQGFRAESQPNSGDLWAIDAPGLTGTPGIISGVFHVDGTMKAQADVNAGGTFRTRFQLWRAWCDNVYDGDMTNASDWQFALDYDKIVDSNPDGSLNSEALDFNWNWSFNFTYGKPFAAGLNMITRVKTVADYAGTLAYVTGNGFAESDFSHTGTFGGVTSVKDQFGNQVTDYTGVSSRGLNLQTTPEPGTMLALGLGIVALGKSRRKRAR